MQSWSPTSWQAYTYEQAANYPDKENLETVVHQISKLPPLVTSNEVNRLKQAIASAGRGESFILQGGDCAESFNDCRAEIITNKLKILLQMSLVLLYGLRKPIIRVGRIAGQYAKPRSSDTETINGVTLPSYRGDLVNLSPFDVTSRIPNPALLIQGYGYAAITLNYIRSLIDSGFADLHHPQRWDLGFVEHSKQAEEYHEIVRAIGASFDFLNAVEGLQHTNLNKVDFYTSHEALHLHYEQALTRRNHDGKWYNLSTHLPWIGMRTAKTGSAHIEYMRGIQNPIGVKVGTNTTPEWLSELLHLLNPLREEGRILLISRMGVNHIQESLPRLIETTQKSKIPVTWACDPMHGNTETTPQGFKTRHFDNILNELKSALTIHREMGSYLGGVHFELTGENVTECIGGARGLSEINLKEAYHSLVDPRLNYEQSLEMSLLLASAY
jgi:3-deoxy-7-phosphoheptulonate synthase